MVLSHRKWNKPQHEAPKAKIEKILLVLAVGFFDITKMANAREERKLNSPARA